ncbi:MAG: cation-translocating P-type ATPase [Candidatus Heimdallarchaeota archaeon]|nr:cation-translocating P-type ATPase [Candidatus Heimdallarchaeota archaeon]
MLKKKKKNEIPQEVEELIPWHNMEIKEVYKELQTDEKGLFENDVVSRLERYGPNKLTISDRFKVIKMVINQFTSFLVILLIIAGTISLIIGLVGAGEEGGTSEIIDAIAIFTIVIINAIIGFVQDYRSNQALAKLKEYFEQEVVVLREGKEKIVHSAELVPGDIVRLEVGDKIPADCRLTIANNFKVDEASLTGESSSVTKNTELVPEEARIHDKKNMIFSGTTCVYGRGEAIVAATGMSTEMGRIAELTQVKEELTPLQQALDKLGKVLGIIILVLCAIVMIIDWAILGERFLESFETAVALAISAVPEGLPAAIVITLAIGVSKMAKKKTIVSKLPAVETLGSVDYICSDKTGTLTRNEMTVKEIWTIDGLYQVGGSGYLLDGDFVKDGKKVDPMTIPSLKSVLQTSYHCNNSAVLREDDRINIKGDPTEAALLVVAEKAGFSKEMLLKMEHEIFFDSDRKRMTTIHDDNGKKYAFMKGSPPVVITRCNYAIEKGKEAKMTKDLEGEIMKSNLALAEKALRVLAVAYRELPKDYDKTKENEIEDDMIFLGLTGMIDPARPEVKGAIEECRMAGITTVMITGDQEPTAVAVAKEIGIVESDEDLVVSGEVFATMTNEELQEKIEGIKVYSRMSPKDKYRVVEILQELDHVVAVTGDGVNDAPALKKADIGVAMGITGTDVSKEVAAMVITDDAFNTIVSAVEEGRNIFENMKKFIRYLLSCNFDEIFAVLIIYAAFQELPFLPLQILFLNLLTDALPALSLSFDPYDASLMQRPPRGKKSSFVRDMYAFASFAGLIALIASLGIFLVGYLGIGDRVIADWAAANSLTLDAEQLHDAKVAYSQTLAFVATLSFELWFVFIARNDNATSFLKSHPFKNKYLIGAVVLSWIFLLGVIYIPPFQAVFTGFKPDDGFAYYLVGWADWGIILGFTLGLCILFEMFRYALRTERMAKFATFVGMH